MMRVLLQAMSGMMIPNNYQIIPDPCLLNKLNQVSEMQPIIISVEQRSGLSLESKNR